jgi:hypothetical protein
VRNPRRFPLFCSAAIFYIEGLSFWGRASAWTRMLAPSLLVLSGATIILAIWLGKKDKRVES